MGRAANTLLKTGEENVTNMESTGQGELFAPPTTKDCGEASLDTDVNCIAQKPTRTEECSSSSNVTTDSCSVTKNETATASLLLQKSGGETTAFDIAVADATELEAKWFLTFEQFVAGVQQEPELCQFFAEQNVIDLSDSSSVDPILSQYTRTILRAT